MKSLMLLVAVSLFSLAAMAAPPGEFRGQVFGQPLSPIEEFEPLGNVDGGIKAYKRRDEKLTIGSATLKGIYYYVWDNRLMRVAVSIDGADNFYSLASALEAAYGKKHSVGTRFQSFYVWDAGAAGVKVKAMQGALDRHDAMWTHLGMESEYAAAKREAAQNAKKDL